MGQKGQVEGKWETTYLGDVQALGGDLAGWSEMADRRGWAGRETSGEAEAGAGAVPWPSSWASRAGVTAHSPHCSPTCRRAWPRLGRGGSRMLQINCSRVSSFIIPCCKCLQHQVGVLAPKTQRPHRAEPLVRASAPTSSRLGLPFCTPAEPLREHPQGRGWERASWAMALAPSPGGRTTDTPQTWTKAGLSRP